MNNCSIISENIQVVLDNVIQKSAAGDAALGMSAYRSAVQNPEVSRLQLNTHLRKRARAISSRARKHFWDSFIRRPQAND